MKKVMKNSTHRRITLLMRASKISSALSKSLGASKIDEIA